MNEGFTLEDQKISTTVMGFILELRKKFSAEEVSIMTVDNYKSLHAMFFPGLKPFSTNYFFLGDPFINMGTEEKKQTDPKNFLQDYRIIKVYIGEVIQIEDMHCSINCSLEGRMFWRIK